MSETDGNRHHGVSPGAHRSARALYTCARLFAISLTARRVKSTQPGETKTAAFAPVTNDAPSRDGVNDEHQTEVGEPVASGTG